MITIIQLNHTHNFKLILIYFIIKIYDITFISHALFYSFLFIIIIIIFYFYFFFIINNGYLIVVQLIQYG